MGNHAGTVKPAATTLAAPVAWRKARLAVEFGLVFGVLPLLYALGWVPLYMLPALWLFAGGCLIVLLHDPHFDRRKLWNRRRLLRNIAPCLPLFFLGALAIGIGTALFLPHLLFGFLLHRPRLWLAVMVFYPILSVYPQGIIYRAFLFHRYAPLFGSERALVLASMVAFAWLHIIFLNWLALGMTLCGGYLFARTYARTGSLLASNTEHALYGCWIFTIGLGRYFYNGHV